MDLVVMVEGAALFSAGPPLVAAALGEQVTKDELGGAVMHTAESGVAHNLAPDDASALALVREYLGYLPSSAWARPPQRTDGLDLGERRLDDVPSVVPRDSAQPYDVRGVLRLVADEGRLLEIQPSYGASLVTALIRLGGRAVAVVANQPLVAAGAVTRAAADKGAHFIEVAGAFHLPVLFVADNPGVMAGRQAERDGTLRSAARMYAAQAALRGPKLHVTLRKAFGFGSSLMAMNPFDRQTITLAFPGATLAGVPASGGADAANAADETRVALDAAESEAAWRTADTMSYDEIIDPRDLRNALLAALRASAGREAEAPRPLRRTGIRP
jgi:acetyl-CoA carboxylase carboxyltransferase component